MVKSTRKTQSPSDIRALNEPQALQVTASDEGSPVALKFRRRWVDVDSVVDRWRIDGEWWRERPFSRMYYECVVDQGLRVTVYHDLVDGNWYQQQVEPP